MCGRLCQLLPVLGEMAGMVRRLKRLESEKIKGLDDLRLR